MPQPGANFEEDARRAFQTPFDAVIRIEIKDGDVIWLDGRTAPPTVSRAAPSGRAPDCIWRGGAMTMARILDGERALESAFISGRLSVTGDMSVMARLKMENRT